MLLSSSPAEERRIYNQIWNGAEQYGFEPLLVGRDIAGALLIDFPVCTA